MPAAAQNLKNWQVVLLDGLVVRMVVLGRRYLTVVVMTRRKVGHGTSVWSGAMMQATVHAGNATRFSV